MVTETVISEGYCLFTYKWNHFYASTSSNRVRPDRHIHIATNRFIYGFNISTNQANPCVQTGTGSPSGQTVTERLVRLDLVINMLYSQVLE